MPISTEEKAKIFIQNTPVAIAMLDPDMNYIAASNQWYEMYNIKNKDIDGENHYEIFPEIKEMPEWLDVHQRALNGEVINNDEDLFIREDGTKQWIKWSVMPWFEDSGEIGGIVMSTEDITDSIQNQEKIADQKRQLERKVKQRTKELEKVNAELESFSYSVSHDLRSPLRAIIGFGQILKKDYSVELDEEGNRLLNIVIENAENMGDLIDDILAFSRLGRSDLSKTSINLKHLCETVYQGLLVNNKELESRINLTVQDLPKVHTDAKMMRQALENLLSNAIKYSSSNKNSIIIKIGYEEKNTEYVFYVKDNGIGFDDQYSHKLFEIFQRLHSQEDFEGTGVGLALVKRIIERQGGEVWAESKPGDGATFYFSLPKRSKND